MRHHQHSRDSMSLTPPRRIPIAQCPILNSLDRRSADSLGPLQRWVFAIFHLWYATFLATRFAFSTFVRNELRNLVDFCTGGPFALFSLTHFYFQSYLLLAVDRSSTIERFLCIYPSRCFGGVIQVQIQVQGEVKPRAHRVKKWLSVLKGLFSRLLVRG